MKWIEDTVTRHLAMRFGADRLYLWCLCGNRACRRMRACKGDVRCCTSLMVDWIEAINQSLRSGRDLAALESGLKTMEEVRAYRIWRDGFDRARKHEQEDRQAEREREELRRMMENLCKTTAREREREEAERKAREEQLIVEEGERGEEKNY
ncbi:MAG: hypothetical protein ACRECF_02200 [Methyloceanibacter sp.]